MVWVAITLAFGATVEKRWLLVIGLASLAITMVMLVMFISRLFFVVHFEPKEGPIWIEDSPPPTRTWSSPRLSPPIERRKCVRRGGVRGSMHKRSRTCAYSPKAPGDCGYQAVLRAAGMPTDHKRVAWLRRRVTQRIYVARTTGEKYANMDMHEVVREMEMTLEAYMQATPEGQWASVVEVAMAATEVGIRINYAHDGSYQAIGEGKKVDYTIVLKESHFFLMKQHKSMKVRGSLPTCRGGMLEHEQALQGLTATPTRSSSDPRKIRVDIRCQGVDIEELVIKELAPMDVGRIKVRIASMIQRAPSSLDVIMDMDDDGMPDWAEVPNDIIVKHKDHNKGEYGRLAVCCPARDTQFIMHIAPNIDEMHLKKNVSKIMGMTEESFDMVTTTGRAWVASKGQEDQVAIIQPRGGMRSVSTTEPFTQETHVHETREGADLLLGHLKMGLLALEGTIGTRLHRQQGTLLHSRSRCRDLSYVGTDLWGMSLLILPHT